MHFASTPNRDSVAPGVRPGSSILDESADREPPYDDESLPGALRWAAAAQWGAMYLLLPRAGKRASVAKNTDAADALLAEFKAEARQLGYRITHARYGRGEGSWRFRVEALIVASTPLVQASLLDSPAQLALF